MNGRIIEFREFSGTENAAPNSAAYIYVCVCCVCCVVCVCVCVCVCTVIFSRQRVAIVLMYSM